jgi:protein tyrosine/serine phosphatase
LLSNVTRKSEVAPRIDELEALAASLPISGDERKANSEAIRAFYILQPDYIDASRDGAVKKYGSLDRYLEERLGVSDPRRSKLRELLTVPKDTPDAQPN